jgi:hypothetical protein
MREDEIREVVDLAVKKSITDILQSFGFEEDERKELKADFNHLRRWRKSVEQTQTYTFKIIVTALVSGLVGACWLGFKAMLGK